MMRDQLSEVNEKDIQKKQKPSERLVAVNSHSHPFWDFWGPILFTFSVYLGVRYYLAEARYIPSGSMLPGLQVQDRLIVEKITFRRRSPRRGEIVVFNSPYAFDRFLRPSKEISRFRCLVANLPIIGLATRFRTPSCDAYIKRVVAVGGDHIAINRKGIVLLNGVKLKESYVTKYCLEENRGTGGCRSLNRKVPIGHVVVLGDNRANSWDSRFWPGGPFLPETEVFGRAIWRFWPFDRIGSLSS